MSRDRVRRDAADLLACMASLPRLSFATFSLPGRWSRDARRLAGLTWREVYDCLDDWRENYAECEARLREVHHVG